MEATIFRANSRLAIHTSDFQKKLLKKSNSTSCAHIVVLSVKTEIHGEFAILKMQNVIGISILT